MNKIEHLISEAKTIPIEVILLRGYMVSKTIQIERMINEIIINQLYDKSTKTELDIFHDFVNDLNNEKRNILLKSTLLKLNKEEKWASDIVKSIVVIYQLRNAVAHWEWTYISDQGSVSFVKENSKRTSKVFNDDLLDEFEEHFWKIYNGLIKISFGHWNLPDKIARS